jgi:hypothetical protein
LLDERRRAGDTAYLEGMEFPEDCELSCAKAIEYIFKVAGVTVRESIFSFDLQAAGMGE